MVDLTVGIHRLLCGICRTTPEFPSTSDSFPVITYTEVSNTEDYSVEGVEHISDITYQVDVWDNGANRKEVERIACEVSRVMLENGFFRVLGRGFRDPSGLHRKMMYFKIYAIN